MSDFPPFLERLLASLGLSTTQVRWRYYRQRNAIQDRLASLKQVRPRRKFCHRCGHLANAGDTTCPQCQRALPTYAGSKLRRWLAVGPTGTRVSMGFITLLLVIFCVHLGMTRFQGLLLPSVEALIAFGSLSTDLVQAGEPWRLLTMGLMHIGIVHLIFNLMAISQTLSAFESEIGSWPTLVLITLTQLGAAGAHMLFHEPFRLTAGASGIAFGIIGFGVAFAHRRGNRPLRRFFLQWFVYGLVFGFLMRANNAAHLGGFLVGLPLGWFLAWPRFGHRKLWKALGMVSLATWIVAVGFLVRSMMAFNLRA